MGSWGVSVAAVIALLAARAAATAFQAPAMQAMVPQIVPEESLVEAGGMSQAISSASYVLGPVVGGALFAAFPLALILVTDLAGALVASATLGVVPVADHRAKGERPRLHPVRELRDALVVAKANFANEVRASFKATVALGATCLACGLLPKSFGGWVAFAVLCGAMGATATCYDVPIVAYMQKSIAPQKLGRAFSAFQIVSMVSTPVGLAVASPVAEELGVSAWFGISGVAIVLLGAVMLVLEGTARR